MAERDVVLRDMKRVHNYLWFRGVVLVLVVHPVYRILLLLRSGHGETTLSVLGVTAFRVRLIRVDGRIELFLTPPRWIDRLTPRWFRMWVSLAAVIQLAYRLTGQPESSRDVKVRSLVGEVWQAALITFVAGVVNALFIVVWVLVVNLALTIIGALVTTFRAVARAIPTVLAILFIAFVTADAWKAFGQLGEWRITALLTALMASAIWAMVVNVRDYADGWYTVLESQEKHGTLHKGTAALRLWRGVAVARLSGKAPVLLPIRPPHRGHRPRDLRHLLARNFRVLYWVTMVLTVILMAASVFGVFLALGVVAINQDTTSDLLSSPFKQGVPDVVYRFPGWGHHLVITRQLLQLSAVLGGIAALTFATVTLAEPESRKSFEEHALLSVRRAISATGYYLAEVRSVLDALDADGILDSCAGINWGPVRRFLACPPLEAIEESGEFPVLADLQESASPTALNTSDSYRTLME